MENIDVLDVGRKPLSAYVVLSLCIYQRNTTYIYFRIYYKGEGVVVPLTRKTRVSGRSIVVALPSQLVEAYDIKHGDVLEITPLEYGTLMIRKSDLKDPQEASS